MKSRFILLVLLVYQQCLFAQSTEPAGYSTYMKTFVDDFNNENYHHLVQTASASFLKSVPEKKLTDFLKGVKEDIGTIELIRFKYFDSKGSAVYHTELTKAWMNFTIGLNDSNMLSRLVVLDPNYNEELPVQQNKTLMQLPFDSTWYVFWGGDTQDENYHVTVKAQKNAFDFVIRNNQNIPYKTDGKVNEDYYAYGRKLYAPCNGKVITVIDTVHDNVPGVMNPGQLTGNTVIIQSDKNEFVLMAHLKTNSIRVKQGDTVTTGEWIGLCGNSGNSSEPHLHLHIMNAPVLNEGIGIKCYFEKLLVNGIEKVHYSPVKGERVQKIQ